MNGLAKTSTAMSFKLFGKKSEPTAADKAAADKAAADKIYDGKFDREGWAPAKTEDWNPVVDLVKFVDSLRRKN